MNQTSNLFQNNSQFPDFSTEGYIIESLLGQNLSGGRVTYKATNQTTKESVVIKQFQFATVGASWSGFAAFQREIELLQQLNHPQIPKYIACFETASGFCLVQEYKNAPSLSQKRYFQLADVEKIAAGVLEILVYLQQQEPAIIHRDIKPENILVDEELNVYLVDFGLARIASEEMGASTMVKGTLGFMPPEQMLGRLLSNASDLYSLGATIICLLTQTPSIKVGSLIDDSFRFKIHQLLPELNLHWVDWLEKIVAPNQTERFSDAALALSALKAINNTKITKPSKLKRKLPKVFAASFGVVTTITIASMVKTTEPQPLPLQIDTPIPQLKKDDIIKRLKKTKQCVGCNLRYTDFRDEDLRSFNLEDIDLTGADLRGADLRGTYLGGANLQSAKLEGANLASTDLRGAIMPDGTIHP